MRLIRRRMKAVRIFKPVEVPSGYVGTTETWEDAGEVLADVQPAENRQLVELYGERTANMCTLYLEKGARIRNGYGAFVLSDDRKPTHRIVSVLRYTDHLVAVAERQAGV